MFLIVYIEKWLERTKESYPRNVYSNEQSKKNK